MSVPRYLISSLVARGTPFIFQLGKLMNGLFPNTTHPFGIYENIKLGLINYTLLGLIEHHGVFIDSGHYVSYIRQSNKWYHCDDKHITETNLLTLSNNVYLMFYAKEVDLGT